MSSVRVPFYHPNACFGAFGKLHGLAWYEDHCLKLEYQVRLLLRSSVRRLDIPVSKIDEIVYEKRWGGGTLTIRPSTLTAIETFPVLQEGELRIFVKKPHRDEAKLLVSEIELALSQHRLEKTRRSDA